MMTRKTTIAGLATLALAAGGVLLSSAPALASIVHRYERQFNGPAGSLEPRGLAIDNACHFAGLSGGACTSFDPSNGDVYVSDNEHGVVDKFSSSGVYQSQLTGPTGGSFGAPYGLAVDQSNGDLYVTDQAHDVVDKFNPAGVYLCQITGAGNATTSSSECDSGEPGVPGGSFASPVAVGVEQLTGAVYVVLGSYEGVVDKFNSSGGYVSQVTGDPNRAFIYPKGVAVDSTCYLLGLSGSACTSFDPSSGDVYMAATSDSNNVDKFDSAGNYLSELTLFKEGGVYSSAGAMTVDQARGDLYLVNNADGEPSDQRIEEFDSSGVRQSEIYGRALPAGAEKYVPQSVAVDASTGDVYIGDGGNHVVDVFGPNIKGPEAFTGGFRNVRATSATLEGEVNPQGNDTTSFFEYGPCATATCSPSDPFGSKQATTPADNGSGVVKVPVEASPSALVPNQTYHYQLVAANSVNQSPPGGEREFTTPAVAPEVTSSWPSFTGFEAAALAGSVNPEHSETTYYFEYGGCATPTECTTNQYTSKTPSKTSSIYGAVPGLAEIEGLAPASEYHYRLVGENQVGRVDAQNVIFTTAPVPALVVGSGAAGGVTQTAAVISGTVNPNGVASTYGFQIGTEAGVYGPEVGIGGVGLGIFEANTLTLALANLQPGTTYHYRLVASNAYTTVYGADQTFTTVGASPSFTQPLALPLLATPPIAFPAESKATTVKALTRAQKLAAALKACQKKSKGKRASCKKTARKKYGPVKKKK